MKVLTGLSTSAPRTGTRRSDDIGESYAWRTVLRLTRCSRATRLIYLAHHVFAPYSLEEIHLSHLHFP